MKKNKNNLVKEFINYYVTDSSSPQQLHPRKINAVGALKTIARNPYMHI